MEKKVNIFTMQRKVLMTIQFKKNVETIWQIFMFPEKEILHHRRMQNPQWSPPCPLLRQIPKSILVIFPDDRKSKKWLKIKVCLCTSCLFICNAMTPCWDAMSLTKLMFSDSFAICLHFWNNKMMIQRLISLLVALFQITLCFP